MNRLKILSLLREGARRMSEEGYQKPTSVTAEVEVQAVAKPVVTMAESVVASIPVDAVLVAVPATDGAAVAANGKAAMLNKVQALQHSHMHTDRISIAHHTIAPHTLRL